MPRFTYSISSPNALGRRGPGPRQLHALKHGFILSTYSPGGSLSDQPTASAERQLDSMPATWSCRRDRRDLLVHPAAWLRGVRPCFSRCDQKSCRRMDGMGLGGQPLSCPGRASSRRMRATSGSESSGAASIAFSITRSLALAANAETMLPALNQAISKLEALDAERAKIIAGSLGREHRRGRRSDGDVPGHLEDGDGRLRGHGCSGSYRSEPAGPPMNPERPRRRARRFIRGRAEHDPPDILRVARISCGR